MSVKGEAGYLQKWMSKNKDKGLGKEPPRPGETSYKLGQGADATAAEVEQLNLKVPKGTKLRLKRLAVEQGGLSMLTIFKLMLDEYEARHREKRRG